MAVADTYADYADRCGLKSYLSAEERDEILRTSTMNMIYLAESVEAGIAGNDADAWAWLSHAELPAKTLLELKMCHGAQFIRDKNLNTRLADETYGDGWLDSDWGTDWRTFDFEAFRQKYH